MAGCTINVNGVDYAIFSGGRINNTKLASKIYYVLRFDGTNVKIVTQGELSTVMSSASALKIRINGNDSIALVCRSSVNILTNKGVYSNQSTLSSIPSSNAVLSKIQPTSAEFINLGFTNDWSNVHYVTITYNNIDYVLFVKDSKLYYMYYDGVNWIKTDTSYSLTTS